MWPVISTCSEQASQTVRSKPSFFFCSAHTLRVSSREDSRHFVSFLAANQPYNCGSNAERETGEYFMGNKNQAKLFHSSFTTHFLLENTMMMVILKAMIFSVFHIYFM